MNELVTIEKSNAMEIFTTEKGLDPLLKKVRDEIDGFTPDISTAKGRKEIASIAHKVAKSKSYLDGVGKDLVAELKQKPKLIDAERKRIRDILDVWKDEVRKPLTEWESAEESRVNAHKDSIAHLISYREARLDVTSSQLSNLLGTLNSIVIDDSFEEFESEAHKEQRASRKFLEAELPKIIAKEKEQAELEQLRKEAAEREQKEREERIAREATDRAKQEAEQAAKAEREAAERRELELKMAAERAEKERLEAIERAKQAEVNAKEKAEREAREEKEREEAELMKREENKRHCSKINNQALKSFIESGIDDALAKQVITLIAKKLIANITINY